MAPAKPLKALVDQMPAPDERGMYTQDIDKDRIDKAIALIHQGGRDNYVALVGMLAEAGSSDDVKPHYALHCLANSALISRNEKARRDLCETLAAKLQEDLTSYNKAFLCQELQWAGGREAVRALGALLLDEKLVDPACMALTAIGDGAAEQLRAALPKASSKCRLAIVQSLGELTDRQSVDALLRVLKDADREVRLAAGWALACIGDSRAVDALLQAAALGEGWERIRTAKHCLVLAENLVADGKKDAAVRVCQELQKTRTQPGEAHIRAAAAKIIRDA